MQCLNMSGFFFFSSYLLFLTSSLISVWYENLFYVFQIFEIWWDILYGPDTWSVFVNVPCTQENNVIWQQLDIMVFVFRSSKWLPIFLLCLSCQLLWFVFWSTFAYVLGPLYAWCNDFLFLWNVRLCIFNNNSLV